MSANNFKTVLLLTPTIRDVALIEFPSTRAEMICTRLAVESLFMMKLIICLLGQEVNHKRERGQIKLARARSCLGIGGYFFLATTFLLPFFAGSFTAPVNRCWPFPAATAFSGCMNVTTGMVSCGKGEQPVAKAMISRAEE